MITIHFAIAYIFIQCHLVMKKPAAKPKPLPISVKTLEKLETVGRTLVSFSKISGNVFRIESQIAITRVRGSFTPPIINRGI